MSGVVFYETNSMRTQRYQGLLQPEIQIILYSYFIKDLKAAPFSCVFHGRKK